MFKIQQHDDKDDGAKLIEQSSKNKIDNYNPNSFEFFVLKLKNIEWFEGFDY